MGDAWDSLVAWAKTEKGQKTLMIAASVIEIGAGIALTATGVGGAAGSMLLSAGASSLIGGYSNEASGGSFFAGWAGGEVGGLVTGGILNSGTTVARSLATSVSLSEEAAKGTILSSYFLSDIGGFTESFVSDFLSQSVDKGHVDLNRSLAVSRVSGAVTMFVGGSLNFIGGALSGSRDQASRAANSVISATNEMVTDNSSTLFNKVHDVK